MTAHAELGASGAHRWMLCPAAPRLSRGRSSESEHAEEGTLAHEVATAVLVEDLDSIAKFEADERVDREMWSAVEDYVEYVERIRARPEVTQTFVEEKVQFDEYVPGGFGTVDFGALSEDTAWVVDLKYGKGVRVDAEHNPQGMLYALGFLQEFGWLADVKTINITVVQPRQDRVSEWSISVDDVLAWAKGELAEAAARVTENAIPVPGEKQCQFCPAKGACSALEEYVRESVSAGFFALDVAPPGEIDDEQLARCLDDAPLIKAWASAVEKEAVSRLMGGRTIPGWKVVQGQKNRQWTDEKKVEGALSRAGVKLADRYSKKLISPAQAENHIGKDHKILTKYVVRPPAGPTLVTEKDERPALNADAADGFEDLRQTQT